MRSVLFGCVGYSLIQPALPTSRASAASANMANKNPFILWTLSDVEERAGTTAQCPGQAMSFAQSLATHEPDVFLFHERHALLRKTGRERFPDQGAERHYLEGFGCGRERFLLSGEEQLRTLSSLQFLCFLRTSHGLRLPAPGQSPHRRGRRKACWLQRPKAP